MSQREPRLQRIRLGLTPTQAAVAWMEELHRLGSVAAWAETLRGCSNDDHPLGVLAAQVGASVRVSTKGWNGEVVQAVAYEAIRDVTFLYHLHLGLNTAVLEALDRDRLHMLALLAQLRQLRYEQRVRLAAEDAVVKRALEHLLAIGRTFAEGTKNLSQDIQADLTVLYQVREAVTLIERQYFNNQHVLFPLAKTDLDEAVRHLEQIADIYNEAFAEEWEPDQRPSSARSCKPRAKRIDPEAVCAAAAERAPAMVQRQVVCARAEVLLVMGNTEQARSLVSRLIWPG